MGTRPDQAELIAGFLSRKPMAEAAFVTEFKRFLRVEVGSNFPSLWPQLSDLQQSALLRLCEMRESPERVGEIRPTLDALAKSLVAGPALALKRVKKMWHSD